MEELRFATRDLELLVLPEAGGRLHRLRAFGVDLLRTPDDPAAHLRDPFYWGSYPMLPWCGRVASGRASVAGRQVDVPANHPDGWAIHGQAYVAPWQVIGDHALRFEGGGSGWPWTYEARQTFSVEGASITVELAITNSDDSPMPAGIGLHPWFAGPPLLRIPAELAYDDNTKSSSAAVPVAGDYDLRSLRELAPGMDSTWTGLRERRVQLAWPTRAIRGEMVARTSSHLVFVSARPLDHADAIALEPQTHAPQGLRRLINDEPEPLAMLGPAETLSLAMTLRFER